MKSSRSWLIVTIEPVSSRWYGDAMSDARVSDQDLRPSGVVTCPHGDACGACTYLGMGYSAQLLQKRRLLRTAFKGYDSLKEIEVEQCLESPEIAGYRNRAKMAVGISKYDPTSLGYFRPRSREIEDAPDCKVLQPEILATTQALRNWLRQNRVPKVLRHVDVRCGSDPSRQHLTLVLRTREMPNLNLDSIRKACKHVNGISVNLNPSAGPQVIKGPIRHEWGSRDLFMDVEGLSLRLSAGSFFQVNTSILPSIHALMKEFFEGGESLADLYSGVGTHGFALQDRFRRVIGIEGVRGAVADAKATIQRFKLRHMKMVSKPVERSLDPLRESHADSVVMNPSRAGAKPEVLEALVASPVQKIAYLSCDPQTLARDADYLVEAGFKVVGARPIDMMPQTRQVEALVLLQR